MGSQTPKKGPLFGTPFWRVLGSLVPILKGLLHMHSPWGPSKWGPKPPIWDPLFEPISGEYIGAPDGLQRDLAPISCPGEALKWTPKMGYLGPPF